MDNGSRTTPAVPTAMLSAVSHELRGPLGVTRGYLRLLALRTDLDERAMKAVTAAGRASDRMAELLDTLADYIRCARGDTALIQRPTALIHVLEHAAGMTTLTATETVRVRAEADTQIVVNADQTRLANALSTLVAIVAFAATDDDRLRLVLRATTSIDEVTIVVDADAASRVETRPFTPLRSGGGIALPLAELIVHLHGGRVEERWSGDTWHGYVVHLPLGSQA
ncbi:MAG: HAMP domain-containing histidine kinase [Acidobacteria bacterium]|nr:HAMP domain-containing histidine kinase [Acidobacteriota bacterium]